MAENSSSNTATVAIVILVIAALVFLYFMFVRTGGDNANIEIDLPEVDTQGAASRSLPDQATETELRSLLD